MPEPEVDAWCAVCDRLIAVARPANEEDAEGNPPASKSKVDENGVPQFIKPMPARIPSKKLKVSCKTRLCKASVIPGANKPWAILQRTVAQPGLKRTNTQTRLAALAMKPTPIETSQPAPISVPVPAAPVYNTELYCSAACADKDLVRSSEQINQLEKEMQALNWNRDELPSPLWPSTESSASASEGEDGVVKLNETTIKVGLTAGAEVEPKIVSQTSSDEFDFTGYFDMAVRGVDYGLMERERRRSIHSQKATPSILTGMMMKRNSASGSGVYGYGFNQTVSSSDSLSSMWSSSDGKTFSEDSNASTYAGYGLHGRPLRGFTPLNKPGSGSESPSGPLSPNSRRPSMASARSLSFSRQAGVAVNGASSSTRLQSGIPPAMSRRSSNHNGEPGSAPASTLFQSYAANFHRTPSSVELARPLPISPPARAHRALGGSRRASCTDEEAFQEALKTERRASTSTSADTMRGRHSSFAPISLALGDYLNANKQDSLASTPTQRLSNDLRTQTGRDVSPGHSMRRSISRDSKTELEFPIFEEEEDESHSAKKVRPVSVASSKSSVKGSLPRNSSFVKGSLPRNSSFIFRDTPSTAITIGDQIVPQGSLPSKPKFCRSPSSPQVTPRQIASSFDEKMGTIGRSKRANSQVQIDAPTTLASGPAERQRKFSESTRSFSWADLEKQGKVTTYALPPAALAKGDAKKLFYFD